MQVVHKEYFMGTEQNCYLAEGRAEYYLVDPLSVMKSDLSDTCQTIASRTRARLTVSLKRYYIFM